MCTSTMSEINITKCPHGWLSERTENDWPNHQNDQIYLYLFSKFFVLFFFIPACIWQWMVHLKGERSWGRQTARVHQDGTWAGKNRVEVLRTWGTRTNHCTTWRPHLHFSILPFPMGLIQLPVLVLFVLLNLQYS